MQIETAFGPGEKGWVFHGGYVRQLTIGQVRAVVTRSEGVDNELEMLGSVRSYAGGMDGKPDNYAPQESRAEEYMCVETGIGSGSIWRLGESIFKTKEECETAAAEYIEEQRLRDAAALKYQQEQRRKEYDSALRVVQRYEAAQAAEVQP